MKQYMLSVYQPDREPPADLDLDQIRRDAEAVQEELKAADGWVFSGGLSPAGSATVVRAKDGDVLMTDGPYVEGKEHVGGFLVVKAPDLDAALAWGRKLAAVLPLPIEVRPIQGDPEDR